MERIQIPFHSFFFLKKYTFIFSYNDNLSPLDYPVSNPACLCVYIYDLDYCVHVHFFILSFFAGLPVLSDFLPFLIEDY